ncbi:hypothetical protein GGC64_006925 [Mycobacterium sp. OAS707]|uniref:hypothetical protein n=1 Tax=Mycobacterium sp. OAS707 TaxID=2663822 RepID=UPI00178A6E1E|nr:hypothetical protein [Mycobacterium sp. OAS707]MBE1552834.1 hypothetical protein [Mycobacterium sp. OAS707]
MLPILGTEAIASGALTRSALRWNYTALLPDVYQLKDARRDLYSNAVAAWLWTKRKGIIAGRAAAALHGVSWIEDSAQVEIIAEHGRRQPGVVVREERIGDDEISTIGELLVTTPARTALDLGRHLARDAAVAHLDALAGLTGVTRPDIAILEERYRGARGMPAARAAIALMDGGARSPRETALRLLLIDAGLPRPSTAISLSDDLWEATIGMGWEQPKVGVDCEESRSGRNAAQDVACHDMLQRLGWYHIRVPPRQPQAVTISRVRRALRLRGWR